MAPALIPDLESILISEANRLGARLGHRDQGAQAA
jgi:hypothetical protein